MVRLTSGTENPTTHETVVTLPGKVVDENGNEVDLALDSYYVDQSNINAIDATALGTSVSQAIAFVGNSSSYATQGAQNLRVFSAEGEAVSNSNATPAVSATYNLGKHAEFAENIEDYNSGLGIYDLTYDSLTVNLSFAFNQQSQTDEIIKATTVNGVTYDNVLLREQSNGTYIVYGSPAAGGLSEIGTISDNGFTAN